VVNITVLVCFSDNWLKRFKHGEVFSKIGQTCLAQMPDFLPADDAILFKALSDEIATLAEFDSNWVELNKSLPEEEIMIAEDTLQSLNSLE
jgi:hypothetical protein